MPFVLMNSPAIFERVASSLFKDMSFVKVSIDDVVIGSKSVAEYINHLLSVKDQIEVLEYIIGSRG